MTFVLDVERGGLLDGLPLSVWADRFWPKVDQTPGLGKGDCWLWTRAQNNRGYGRLARNTGFSVLAHRLSWMLEHGEDPGDLKVLHRCDVRLCVRPSCLFLGTTADNQRDASEKRRLKYKITPEMAEEMYRLRSGGLLIREVAGTVGVSVRHTHKVLSGNHRFSEKVT